MLLRYFPLFIECHMSPSITQRLPGIKIETIENEKLILIQHKEQTTTQSYILKWATASIWGV